MVWSINLFNLCEKQTGIHQGATVYGGSRQSTRTARAPFSPESWFLPVHSSIAVQKLTLAT